jgi:hypothetical protein
MKLENNSKEMKTIVETFVIEETASLIYDNEQLDNWNSMVKELGLTGQTEIQTKEKSPIPFMHLKESLKNILECLCPRKVKLECYNITPIPVEILELALLSKRENYFQELEIWYDDKSPDPVCVGITKRWENGLGSGYIYSSQKEASESTNGKKEEKDLSWSYRTEHYLIGKWADVKHSFEQLKEMATKRYLAEQGNSFRRQIKEAQRGLDDLETSAFNKFN